MTKGKCRHLTDCQQQIIRPNLVLCLGKNTVIDWHQDDCFKFTDLNYKREHSTERHSPNEWLQLFEEEKRESEVARVGT